MLSDPLPKEHMSPLQTARAAQRTRKKGRRRAGKATAAAAVSEHNKENIEQNAPLLLTDPGLSTQGQPATGDDGSGLQQALVQEESAAAVEAGLG